MKKQSIYVGFCLMLALGYLQILSWTKDHFNDSVYYQMQTKRSIKEKNQAELKALLIKAEYSDFQYQMAKSVPSLAKNLRQPASFEPLELPSVLMAKGKQNFQDKQWDKANHTFRQVIEQYPQSSEVIEAYFLKGETEFLMGEDERCMDTVQTMLKLYPEQKMTGYLLLRMGQVLESRKKIREADEVYKVVLTQFSDDKNLQNQAQVMLARGGGK